MSTRRSRISSARSGGTTRYGFDSDSRTCATDPGVLCHHRSSKPDVLCNRMDLVRPVSTTTPTAWTRALRAAARAAWSRERSMPPHTSALLSFTATYLSSLTPFIAASHAIPVHRLSFPYVCPVCCSPRVHVRSPLVPLFFLGFSLSFLLRLLRSVSVPWPCSVRPPTYTVSFATSVTHACLMVPPHSHPCSLYPLPT